jgi:signal transduction histidine kinase
MCADKIVTIDSRRERAAPFCAELFDAAEREMAAFVSSVGQLFDVDLTQHAADYWIEVLETAGSLLDKGQPNWRQITIAAGARLAKNFNLDPSSFESQSIVDGYVPQDGSWRLNDSDRTVGPDNGSSELQLASKGQGSIEHDSATLEFGKKSDDDRSTLQDLRCLLEDRENELRQAKGKLRKAEPLLAAGNLAQSISHDMRNHLAVIYANVELLSDLVPYKPERPELLGEVRATIHEMIHMLDTLNLCQHTSHLTHSSWASLIRVIEHAVVMVQNHPDARGVELAVQGNKVLEGWIDSSVLGSAVYNLLLNACQSVKRVLPPRKVRIVLSETGGSIHVRVVDNGLGVPEAIRETLFQPFVSAGRPDSLGLGLTIAERAVRQLGGFLDLETSTPGNTVFAICFSPFTLTPGAQDTGGRRYQDPKMAY